MSDEQKLGLCLAVCFVWLFLIPVFSGSTMTYFRYVPDQQIIGGDLAQMLHYTSQLGIGNVYVGKNIYPPFAMVLFSPLVNVPKPYLIISLLTVISYCGLFWLSPKTNVAMLIFLSGFVGYGMQFELERGQWNVVVFFISMLALRLWDKNKLIAGSLLTLAIQLKIWPAIFIVEIIRRNK